ncbi:MAG: glycosyltransferase [Pseudobutyrivibrio sp.]|nr:glycosyltransferase [Pseudobutyrivibrio sp.]
MPDKLISIIVPVYNVAAYLGECLESILTQTYSFFEVILIDDGSTDGSEKMCDAFAEKDTRIKVIHKANGGLSSARNSGLEIANGEYICFVDSDDSIEPLYLAKLCEAIENGKADIAFCDIDSPKLCQSEYSFESYKKISYKDSLEWLTNHNSREYVQMVVAWNKLYKKSVIQNLRYPVGKFHEDEFMINEIIKQKCNMVYIPEKLYKYRENAQGITGIDKAKDVRHLDVIDAYDLRINWALNNEREFAVSTLKNAFYKLIGFSKMGGEMEAFARKRYLFLYKKYYDILTLKQRLKYKLILFFPSLL